MERILPWVISLRPLACLLGFFVCLASWGVAYSRIDLIALYSSLECFWFLCATMEINDWFDRHHDAGKNPPKDFALRHERAFLWFSVACWGIEVCLIALMFSIDCRLGLLALCRGVFGIFYSWTRRIPYLAAITVALASALCTVTPAMVGGPNHGMWVFLAATAMVIFARENYKDIEDFQADYVTRYKATIAAIKGPNVARIAGRLSLVFGGLIFLAMPLTILPEPAAWGGLFCLSLMSISAYVIATSNKKAKKLLDGGMAAFLLVLNSSYWLLMLMSPVHGLAIRPLYFVIAFITLTGVILAKPRHISALVLQGLDGGKERLANIAQNKALWPTMYGLFWLVVFICRLLSSRVGGPVGLVDSLTTASLLTVILIAIVITRPPHVRVGVRTYGYTVIERLSIGIVIGFFFAVCHLVGLPIKVVAFVIPLISIVQNKLEVLCWLLRGYGCVIGIITGIAIVEGIAFALINILPVYGLIVALYYLWRWHRRFPVYVPRRGKIRQLMLRVFVPEEVQA